MFGSYRQVGSFSIDQERQNRDICSEGLRDLQAVVKLLTMEPNHLGKLDERGTPSSKKSPWDVRQRAIDDSLNMP